jgi:putative transposase
MNIKPELLDELLLEVKQPHDLIGENGLIRQLTKALLERALEAELTHQLGHEPRQAIENPSRNSRNGKSKKTVQGEFGALEVSIPRDRQGSFEPVILPKHERRFSGFDDKIIALYAKGSSVRDIKTTLEELYGVEVSPSLISQVTDAILEDIDAWQARPLEPVYAILYLDCLFVKIREQGVVVNKAVYLGIGVQLDGHKDVLGLWLADTEGAKFWLSVLTEIRNRGVEDVLITCVDGLKGFPEAIEAVFPQTIVQLCLVHLTRYSLNFASWKERRAMAQDLRCIYQAGTLEAAQQGLEAFCKQWDGRYPVIGQSWKRNWERIMPMFSFPPEIRKLIYTTNAIESLNASLRKAVRSRGSFPDVDSLRKVLFLAIRARQTKWGYPLKGWRLMLNWFAVRFADRLPLGFNTQKI